jgi:hypothetical protein
MSFFPGSKFLVVSHQNGPWSRDEIISLYTTITDMMGVRKEQKDRVETDINRMLTRLNQTDTYFMVVRRRVGDANSAGWKGAVLKEYASLAPGRLPVAYASEYVIWDVQQANQLKGWLHEATERKMQKIATG